MTFSDIVVPSSWPSKAFSTPSLRLARREPIEKEADLSIDAVPLAASCGGAIIEPEK